MLDDGLYSRFPRPDFALALHCTADQPTGTVHYCPGPLLASSTSVTITIRGKGGHGAWPHRTVDPIVLAALVVVDLQTIVSREVEPIQPAVVTVGSIHGGTKHNIIPDEVKLQLTLRTFSEPVRQQLLAGIRRRVEGLARAHQAPEPTVSRWRSRRRRRSTRPRWSNGSSRPSSRPSAPSTSSKATPVMGAEDFGLFGEEGIPICMFWLGTIDPARLEAARAQKQGLPALHSSKYYPRSPAEHRDRDPCHDGRGHEAPPQEELIARRDRCGAASRTDPPPQFGSRAGGCFDNLRSVSGRRSTEEMASHAWIRNTPSETCRSCSAPGS